MLPREKGCWSIPSNVEKLPGRDVLITLSYRWRIGTHAPTDRQFLRHSLGLEVLNLGFILSCKPWEIGPRRIWGLEIFTSNLKAWKKAGFALAVDE